MIPLTENPTLEARAGCRFVVRDVPQNALNNFWAPHIGCSGIVATVSADGLVTVVLDNDAIVVEGVDQKRFTFSRPPSRPYEPTPSLWRRIRAFWRK